MSKKATPKVTSSSFDMGARTSNLPTRFNDSLAHEHGLLLKDLI